MNHTGEPHGTTCLGAAARSRKVTDNYDNYIAVDQFEKAKYWPSVELRLVEKADAGATMGNVQAMPALQWH